jgi:2-keto-4-pentenoate hydratase/2-oxohepta-3-ene-1,7-dioic acid hydratase in catechol pathway
MKLVRFGKAGQEKPGIVDETGTIRDLSSIVSDFTPDRMTHDLIAQLASTDISSLPAVEAGVRMGPPLKTTGHFIAIGLNFVDHAIESGLEPPVEPVVFSKAPSCIVGPDDDVVIPKGSEKTDWEVELAIVIGKRASYISEDEALSHVFGYMVCDDVSERAFQIEGTGQWIKGKSAPSFGPIGPWLVTPDELGDVQNLDMWLDVNGERRQTGNTKTMIFNVAHLVHYLSQIMILEPGDIITTGTPPGVGMGMKPPKYLKPGDVITLGIEGLGEQRQNVVACTD